MARQAPLPDPTFLPEALTASGAGIWEHDVLRDRMHYCHAYADLYGLSPEDGLRGICIDALTSKVHPDDRAHRRAKCSHMIRHRGAAILRYRVLPSFGVTRWIMLRGRYEADPRTGDLRGRGIAIDITPGVRDHCIEGELSSFGGSDDRLTSAIDRATHHVRAASQAFRDLGAEGDVRLWPAAEALLLEIAHQLAGDQGPVVSSRTRH